jgi:secreted trypsin-like serine protease
MLKLVLLSLMNLGFPVQSIASNHFEPFINGGEKVLADDPIAKSTVMLETESQYCSATVIGNGLLLTAAHCLNEGATWILIHFSGLEGGMSRTASRSLRHEDYQDLLGTTRNDVALVFFEGGLPEGFVPVSILPSDQKLKIGEDLQLAGYGGGGPLGVLAKVKLQVAEFINNTNLVKFEQTVQRGICHGDSGGPAFKAMDGHLYLAGVASYANEIDCSGYSVYTSASPYISWIQKKQN